MAAAWEEAETNAVELVPKGHEGIEHEMTHFPCRSWCRHCASGRRGKEEDCRRATTHKRNVPEIHVDFMFIGDLVARERERMSKGLQLSGAEEVDWRMDLWT